MTVTICIRRARSTTEGEILDGLLRHRRDRRSDRVARFYLALCQQLLLGGAAAIEPKLSTPAADGLAQAAA
jgi:hypothetical protein